MILPMTSEQCKERNVNWDLFNVISGIVFLPISLSSERSNLDERGVMTSACILT